MNIPQHQQGLAVLLLAVLVINVSAINILQASTSTTPHNVLTTSKDPDTSSISDTTVIPSTIASTKRSNPQHPLISWFKRLISGVKPNAEDSRSCTDCTAGCTQNLTKVNYFPILAFFLGIVVLNILLFGLLLIPKNQDDEDDMGYPNSLGPQAPVDMYGAPPLTSYSASQPSDSYSAPQAPSDSYGAPPDNSYGAPPMSSYGAPPMPSYGAPPPTPDNSYGAPPMTGYGAPPPPPDSSYGAPPMNMYGAPPQQPDNSYGAPSQQPPSGTYGAPPMTGYGAPPDPMDSYGAPDASDDSFGASPMSGYAAPQTPDDSYGAPDPDSSYGAPPVPNDSYGAPPMSNYGAPPPPSDSYGSPSNTHALNTKFGVKNSRPNDKHYLLTNAVRRKGVVSQNQRQPARNTTSNASRVRQ